MDREHKYRVWDKEEKRMITNEQDFIPLIITNKGVLRLSAEHKDNLYTLIPFGNRFIPMKDTGLKDKDNKEIYEDDIYIDEEGYKYTVKIGQYDRHIFQGNMDEISYGVYILYENGEIDSNLKLLLKRLKYFGNIYKNQELLEK